MAQRFNADTSIPDLMVLNNVATGSYYSDAISLLGVTTVSFTYYSPNAVAGNLNFQVTDMDTFITQTIPVTREATFNAGGQTATSVSGPTVNTLVLGPGAIGAKWLRVWFQCTTAGSLRVAVTLKANVAS